MTRLLAAPPRSSDDAGIAGGEPAIAVPTAGIDVEAANELLASVGFLLVPGAPFDRGASYLMIAMRPKPTLAHFDPERIDYWTANNGTSTPASLEWPMGDVEPRYSWGPIRIVDRLAARNEFASFGGRLTVARDGDHHAALFRSDAPILALGGHSGPADVLGVHLAGFFALLRGVAGAADARGLIEAASPVALYACFLVHTLAVFRARSALGMSAPRIVSLLSSEMRRLERDNGADASTGVQLQSLL